MTGFFEVLGDHPGLSALAFVGLGLGLLAAWAFPKSRKGRHR